MTRESIKLQCAAQIAATNELRVLAKEFKSDINPAVAKQIRIQLKTIVHQLELADKHEWLSTLREAKTYFSNHQKIGRAFQQPGNQIRFQLEDIIRKYDHSRVDHHAIHNSNDHDVEQVCIQNASRANLATTEHEVMVDLKERIAALKSVLQQEMDALRSKGFWLFHSYELKTKEAKLNALRELESQDSLLAMITTAWELKKDKRVMRSVKRHHTSDLINDITLLPPALAIDRSELDSPLVMACSMKICN